jgi:hypothetical protein
MARREPVAGADVGWRSEEKALLARKPVKEYARWRRS